MQKNTSRGGASPPGSSILERSILPEQAPCNFALASIDRDGATCPHVHMSTISQRNQIVVTTIHLTPSGTGKPPRSM
jgi:hypothetical protein